MKFQRIPNYQRKDFHVNTRKMKAVLLIITFVSVGFGLLPSPLIQDAHAITCDEAMKLCERYYEMAELLCDFYGESHVICDEAWYQYEYICFTSLFWCDG